MLDEPFLPRLVRFDRQLAAGDGLDAAFEGHRHDRLRRASPSSHISPSQHGYNRQASEKAATHSQLLARKRTFAPMQAF
jgi:hypothetical protein